jgi:DNA-binding transcriptional MerR regulator
MQESWTIAELAELAAETLAATDPAGPPSGPARADGRIRDVPNERLVRWYATVGLVDPPLSRRGRVARYGRRHLLQLVAVKRRQAEGRSLAEIQAELTGATDDTLAAVARVPDIQPTPEALPAAPARFWARQPGQLAPGADQHVPENGRPDEAVSGSGQQMVGTGRVDGLMYDEGRPAPDMERAADGAERRGGPTADAERTADGAERRGGPTADAERAADGAERRGGPTADAERAARGAERRGRRGRWMAAAAAGGDHEGRAGGTPAGGRGGILAGGIVHGVRLAPGVTLLLEGGDRELGAEDVIEIINAARPLLEELAERRLRLAAGDGTGPSAEVGDLAEEGRT